MIKLTKASKPDILVKNADTWTKTLLDKINNNVKPTDTEKTKYRHPEIKAAIVLETNGKCAYCESKLKHVHHGDIEHISPKSLIPEKTFDWENLTLACEICNQNKSDKDPHLQHIIDPYQIDPSLHLVFMGALVFPLGSKLGKNTEVIIDLNRVALCETRKEKLEQVMAIFETILREDLPVIVRKTIYDNLLVNEGSPSSAYSAMITAAIHVMKKKLPEGFAD
ncbi:HNH endonuclease [Methyloglobulus sp.]|uniref:HNH endonuclease n=1 Tax=Methyloglobulus sp. TaxID=2518622 RepID=UPI0032B80003